MGKNNKQRRATKQRQRARRGSARPQFRPDPGWDATAAYGLAELQVTSAVRRLSRRKVDEAEMLATADALVRRLHPIPHHVIDEVVADLLARLVDTVRRGGWNEADLDQLVRRCAGSRHVRALRPGASEGLASALRVAALLATAPLVEVGSVTGVPGPGRAEHPKLAKVRALLAKAESTEFDEEAEALSAKAQDLITRYALGRLADHARRCADPAAVSVRRIWLDAPYVRAKGSLVHEVAAANRCRAALTESLGFSLLVGADIDLEAVELLVTSLLVQANGAMLRHGRRTDARRTSRTRSFRQSFLFAYAARIGERLRAATDAVAVEHGGRLLPVVLDHEARVSAAFEAMVPHTVSRATSITDAEGWAAGVAAADLALLDVNGKITERAG